jgi:hypothetical protein
MDVYTQREQETDRRDTEHPLMNSKKKAELSRWLRIKSTKGLEEE